MTPLYKQYERVTPIGVYGICNFGGLAVLNISDDGEQAVCAWHFGEKYENVRRHKIHTTHTGRAYINKGGRRYYFDQIMRVGGANA